MSSEVIVVGGGVIGLTTAIVLAESGRRVRVWRGEQARGTASATAGGLWWPYRIEPEIRVGAWALASLRVYEELARTPEATGVRLVEGLHAGTGLDGLGPWAAEVAGLRPCPQGLRARLPLIDMPVHLQWLERRLADAGGTVETREIERLPDAPVVVNCTGLGARNLVPDPEVRPVRGQLVVVENPGIRDWYTAVEHGGSETTYFFPQPYGLLLGGTAEEDDWNPAPDPATAERIIARCALVRPEIAGARVLAHRVGLRPVRDSGVRVEREPAPDRGVLVHNYGHGGAGVTVAWGCAEEAAALAASSSAPPSSG
ncbi:MULTISPECIES: FAD-dependent oxidoreductase [unclassified Streptomyces]|uniref:FAD-dependent oxidoreductase n=1 Tax=unclassified Streptomyces TaxID=2593676 RepID=UPI00381AE402